MIRLSVCPLCGKKSIRFKKGSYAFSIKNKRVATPVIEFWECSNCGEAFFDKTANKKIDAAMLRK